jgi:hypothetical protein
MFVVYALTSAPGNTVWDSGEFIAAAASWGIPHPPGTPLYVTIARAWMLLFGFLSPARAVNLLSAAATAASAACVAWWISRITGGWVMGLAAGLCAGAMTTAWGSATETEAYATAMLLAMAMLLAGDRAGREERGHALALTAYLIALAVPMHLSALVAAPPAILLATRTPNGEWRRTDAALLLAVAVLAAGVGRASAPIALAGAAGIIAACAFAARARRVEMLRAAAGVALALSAIAIMHYRAFHDPALSEGDARTWQGTWEIVGRRLYGSFALWPRNAPLWLQFAQFFEYADWQVALGISPHAMPSPPRTAITLAYIALGVAGARAHRRIDARTWRAILLLFLGASIGLVIYLNFFPGMTLGFGIVPADVHHEVRERDYFFVLAFWAWGIWAGIGAVALAQRIRPSLAPAGLALAALPIALNWHPMDRARGPERDTSSILARALLWGAPHRAFFLTSSDEDTYAVLEATIAERQRTDLTVMVWGWLFTDFGRAQLARRDAIVVDTLPDPMQAFAVAAKRAGRPVAVAYVFPDTTALGMLGGRWMLRGLAFVPADSTAVPVAGFLVDTLAARAFSRAFPAPELPEPDPIDWLPRHSLRVVRCPEQWLAVARKAAPEQKLDSACKLK